MDFLEQWHKNKKNKISPNTFENCRGNIQTHIKPALGDFQLSQLNSLAIDNFYTELESKGLSSATIRKIHTIVRSSLEYAKDYKFISINPAAVVKPPTVKHKDIEVWEEKEIVYFLDAIKDEYDYIIYYLALYTGMRKGEILGLKWQDIDFYNNKIRVMRSYTKTGFSKGKTDKARRVIDIDDNTIEELKAHEKVIEKNKRVCGNEYNDLDLLICRVDGSPVDVRNVNRRFEKLIKKLDMKKIRFHDLRHTHATLMLAMGIPVKVVSERLGHEKVELTLNTYAHLLPSMQLDAIQLFNDNMQKHKNLL